MRKRLERMIAATYLIALVLVLVAPISMSANFELLWIGADKWLHFGLFGGLSGLFLWNARQARHAELMATAMAIAVAVSTETAQRYVGSRMADAGDLIANLVGITFGVVAMRAVIARGMAEKTLGVIVTLLGLALCVVFLMADAIGAGSHSDFGPAQFVGAVLGALVVLGGAGLYGIGRLRESFPA